jgi:hypothetical protein
LARRMTPLSGIVAAAAIEAPPRSRLGPRAIELPCGPLAFFAAAIYRRIGSSLRMEKARPALGYAMRGPGNGAPRWGAKRRAVDNFDVD